MSRKLSADESKARILESAFKVIAEHSISGASMSRIAACAGVSKALLHYHFKKKEMLLASVLDFVLEKLLEIPLETASKKLPPFEEIKGIFEKYKTTLSADPDLFVVFYDFWVHAFSENSIRESIAKRFDSFRDYIGQVVLDGVASGDFSSEKSHTIPPLMLSFLEGASVQLIANPESFNIDLYNYMAIEMISLLAEYKGER